MSELPGTLDLNDRFVKHLRNTARKEAPSAASKDVRSTSAEGELPKVAGSPAKRSSPGPDLPISKARCTPERDAPTRPVITPSSRPRGRPDRGVPAGFDFVAVPREKKQLWQEGSPALARPLPRGMASGPASRRTQGGGGSPGDMTNELEPVTRPISQEQLIAEVKGIYSGLVMIESRCIEVDTAQTSLNDNPESTKLTDDRWQALISLHRSLLHEHHDFFLASQHPSAGPALCRLATKYAMPARMWRHGIHSFLELFRHRLPGSSEYMVSFIYLAYSMMALLFETVPTFEDTWIKCLGDLGRYRMAIEDDDVHDRNVWTAVSRSWYSKASDKTPTMGSLHHHPTTLRVAAQLLSDLNSLDLDNLFEGARDSVPTLFGPDSMYIKDHDMSDLNAWRHETRTTPMRSHHAALSQPAMAERLGRHSARGLRYGDRRTGSSSVDSEGLLQVLLDDVCHDLSGRSGPPGPPTTPSSIPLQSDWKVRGLLWTESIFPSDSGANLLNLPDFPGAGGVFIVNHTLLRRGPMTGPIIGVALSCTAMATGRAQSLLRSPKRLSSLAIPAVLLLLAANCPQAAAAWTMDDNERALDILDAVVGAVAGGSAISVAAVRTYGPDLDVRWLIAAYSCWAVSFPSAVVVALLRRSVAGRRKLLLGGTFLIAVQFYVILISHASSTADGFTTIGPFVLVISLWIASALIDYLLGIMRAALGA